MEDYGYIETEHFSEAAHIQHRSDGLRVKLYGEVSSTNDLVREAAENGEAEGLVIIAEAQTKGRGRQGHSFLSPLGTGLYMSLLLRPQLAFEDSVLLTCAAAAAVSSAAEKLSGRSAGIKWVNDIYIDGKKVCGILTEASLIPGTARLSYAILGIGVNLLPPEGGFPPELADKAGAVFYPAHGDMRLDLAEEILSRFMAYYRELDSCSFLNEYRARSLAIGRQITVMGNPPRDAVAVNLDDRCRLLVRYPDGTKELLDSGEISIKLNSSAL